MNRLLVLLSVSFFLLDDSSAQIPGLSVFLDGSKDYIEIEDNNSLDIEDEITIEAWINPCSYSSYNAIVAKQWCQGAQLSYFFGLRNGFLEWGWDDDGNCTISNIFRSNGPVMPIDQWTHVAVVHTPEGVRLYINGSESAGGLVEGSFSTINTSTSPVRIGVYRNLGGDFTNYFHGRIDDVRIWNQSLSGSSIAERRNNPLSGDEAGLVAYYPMENSGLGQGVSVINEANATGAVNDGITIGSDISPRFISTASVAVCNDVCGESIGVVYGTNSHNERGVSLAATFENDGLYVAGTKEDSILLIKQDLNGAVLWARTFDIIPGLVDFPTAIIVDSDGMIAICGIGGDKIVGGVPFVFRYNPQNHQILWTQQYVSSETSVCYTILQKGNGNYVATFSPLFHDQSNIDAELLEIDKNTGAVVPSLAKTYSLVHAESLLDITYDGQYLYGTGRYEDGGTLSDLRTVIAKIDPANGHQLWVKMGHVREDLPARLYGSAIIIDDNSIVVGSYGDPEGSTTINTELYLQKADLEGNILWCKQYELSGQTSHCHEVIRSNDGYVILATTINADQEIILLKTDLDGNLLWAKKFEFSGGVNLEMEYFGWRKLIELNGQLIFPAYDKDVTGEENLVVVRTNLHGEVDNGCLQSFDFTVPVEDIEAEFYDVTPSEVQANPEVTSRSPASIPTLISSLQQCIQSDTFFITIDTLICAGQSFEGYTLTGEYEDVFEAANGCDSIRTINLTVIGCNPIIHYDLEACESYMHNGSHMIFTEFVPDYPTELSCADVEANHVDMEPSPMSKHSCTPGVNGTIAMCIGASPSCAYNPGDVTSLIISFSVDIPHGDSVAQITGLEFFEKAPTTYSWIDGPSGPNNYPRFYGIRILKNGTVIFQQSGISTTGNWTLQRFDFLHDSLFTVHEDSDFRIELLPYCPVGNGAEVSAWDIDEIRIFGGCYPFMTHSIIAGGVATKTGKIIPNTYLHLADNANFDLSNNTKTNDAGQYLFDDLRLNSSYYIKGYKNDNVLQGVSTLDLILMQRHLLGIQPLSSLRQHIAADINRNGSLSVIDMVELRKMLLGIYNEFPKNTSWRFGVLPQEFTGTDISAFTEVGSVESLQDGITIINFEGIKIGDVNEDIRMSLQGEPIITRNADKISFRIDDVPVRKGYVFKMEVTSENIHELQGFQLALMCKDLSLVSVESASLPVTDDNISFTNEGLLRMSWNHDGSYPVIENEVLFTLTFKAAAAGMISEKISVHQNGLQPEVYTGSELKTHGLFIEFERPAQQSEINSFRIEPNPLTTEAAVKFTLSTGGETVINFFDPSGKLVYSIQKEYPAGDHIEHIQAKDLLSGDGVIYCQLICNGYTSIQKLVLLK